MSKFPLTLSEYNRVHQVIHGVVRAEGTAEKACTFFSIVGTYLLKKHFGMKARAVAGGFALCVEEGSRCLFYGKDAGGRFSWGDDAFHMWIQTETHIIDFMAPIYAESFAEAKPDITIPRKMFQKPISEDKQSLDELVTAGDFMVFPDPELSDQLIDHFLGRAVNTDLLGIADTWFGSRRGKQQPTLPIGSNDGIVHQLTLPATIARSPW